ncbi:hypothetical protein [Christensenella massiliensis]|uniref:Peptidase M13 N-terminal domain-containing protein n=1 Tax=Christensenella massiliensis TaxID=1805714 RepID=A0AAU8A6Y4_9FIRM
MKIIKRVLAVLFAAALLFAAACSAQPQAEESAPPSASAAESAQDGAQGGAPGAAWVNSDISGSVTAETQTDPKDDFNAAVNQEWMAGTELGTQMQASTFTERSNEVMAQVMALITDESQASHEAQLVREFYNDYVDMESRNALGMEPVLPLLGEIEAIETLDELTAYLADWGTSRTRLRKRISRRIGRTARRMPFTSVRRASRSRMRTNIKA